jgi:hypothetical protein
VKDGGGCIHSEASIPTTRIDLTSGGRLFRNRGGATLYGLDLRLFESHMPLGWRDTILRNGLIGMGLVVAGATFREIGCVATIGG